MPTPELPSCLWEHIVDIAVRDVGREARECTLGRQALIRIFHDKVLGVSELQNRFSRMSRSLECINAGFSDDDIERLLGSLQPSTATTVTLDADADVCTSEDKDLGVELLARTDIDLGVDATSAGIIDLASMFEHGPQWGFGGLASSGPRSRKLRALVSVCARLDRLCTSLGVRPLPQTLWSELVTRRCELIPRKHQLLTIGTTCDLLSITPKQLALRLRHPVEPAQVLEMHAHMLLDDTQGFVVLSRRYPALVLDRICSGHYYWFVPTSGRAGAAAWRGGGVAASSSEPAAGTSAPSPPHACLALPSTPASELQLDARLAGVARDVVEPGFAQRPPSRAISFLDVLMRERPEQLLALVSAHLQATDRLAFDRIAGS